nr:hypothetical protein CFP56_11618 [Quercus suber]
MLTFFYDRSREGRAAISRGASRFRAGSVCNSKRLLAVVVILPFYDCASGDRTTAPSAAIYCTGEHMPT